ncbi:hypothetical protein BDF19DRAFT_464516, partial [Syncephalis fuscata]
MKGAFILSAALILAAQSVIASPGIISDGCGTATFHCYNGAHHCGTVNGNLKRVDGTCTTTPKHTTTQNVKCNTKHPICCSVFKCRARAPESNVPSIPSTPGGEYHDTPSAPAPGGEYHDTPSAPAPGGEYHDTPTPGGEYDETPSAPAPGGEYHDTPTPGGEYNETPSAPVPTPAGDDVYDAPAPKAPCNKTAPATPASGDHDNSTYGGNVPSAPAPSTCTGTSCGKTTTPVPSVPASTP